MRLFSPSISRIARTNLSLSSAARESTDLRSASSPADAGADEEALVLAGGREAVEALGAGELLSRGHAGECKTRSPAYSALISPAAD